MSRPSTLTLDDVADAAAAGQMVRDYLDARGIRTTATLALLARTEDHLETTLAIPLFNGWKTPDGRIQAILPHMWPSCRRDWLAQQTPCTPASPTPTATPPTTTGMAKASTSDDRIPKSLAVGACNEMLKKYQEVQLHGVNRVFPQQELLGAEPTLARMYHELHHSRMFSPIALGEIVEKRSFTLRGT